MLTYLMELAIHEWDLRSTREPSPILSEEIMPLLMDRTPGKIGQPWSSSFPKVTDFPGPISYRFNLSRAGAADLDVVVEDDKVRAEPSRTAPANFCVSYDTGTFSLLMYGRFSLRSAVAAGRLTAEGDPGLMTSFDQWLAGALGSTCRHGISESPLLAIDIHLRHSGRMSRPSLIHFFTWYYYCNFVGSSIYLEIDKVISARIGFTATVH